MKYLLVTGLALTLIGCESTGITIGSCVEVHTTGRKGIVVDYKSIGNHIVRMNDTKKLERYNDVIVTKIDLKYCEEEME